MSQIKADLICEIIRRSQTNLLGKKELTIGKDSEFAEAGIVEWIKNNAAEYRRSFMALLERYSTTELGEMLKRVTESPEDLNQILEMVPVFAEKKRPL